MLLVHNSSLDYNFKACSPLNEFSQWIFHIISLTHTHTLALSEDASRFSVINRRSESRSTLVINGRQAPILTTYGTEGVYAMQGGGWGLRGRGGVCVAGGCGCAPPFPIPSKNWYTQFPDTIKSLAGRVTSRCVTIYQHNNVNRYGNRFVACTYIPY